MYQAQATRYDCIPYARCGRSGLKLPRVSLGLWHNFGGVDSLENARAMLRCAFDHGITHFDLANNYGPPYGSAEETFGRLLRDDFLPYRDELIISTKAGYDMWPGPYGDRGSRKYMLASLDQSLKRMGLEYVDIFYSHRYDPETPLEETCLAMDQAVRSGKALYVGISNYNREQTARAQAIFQELKTPFVISQDRYSMLDRWTERDGLLDYCHENGVGVIAFSPLAQGLLTDRYLDGISKDSRAGRGTSRFLTPSGVTEEKQKIARALNQMAQARGQSLAQMALGWVLREGGATSVLIGASRAEQIIDCVGAVKNTTFSEEELSGISAICAQ